MLTRRQLEVLKLLMALPEDEGKEIVCDGGRCAVGHEFISKGTVNGLLGHMAVKDSGYAGAGCEIYIPTENTQHIIERPALADEMVARVFARRPFYVDQTGTVRDA